MSKFFSIRFASSENEGKFFYNRMIYYECVSDLAPKNDTQRYVETVKSQQVYLESLVRLFIGYQIYNYTLPYTCQWSRFK